MGLAFFCNSGIGRRLTLSFPWRHIETSFAKSPLYLNRRRNLEHDVSDSIWVQPGIPVSQLLGTARNKPSS